MNCILMYYNDFDNLHFKFEISTNFCLEFRIQTKYLGERGNILYYSQKQKFKSN